MRVAGTGHRPQKIGGFSEEAERRRTEFAKTILKRVRPDEVISGMALGWDQNLAVAAIALGIPLTAAVPFKGQESIWPPGSRERYRKILERAGRIVYVNAIPEYNRSSSIGTMLNVRNEWMVDQLGPDDKLLALWSGASGGTANCIRYAEKKGVSILNVWEDWRQS